MLKKILLMIFCLSIFTVRTFGKENAINNIEERITILEDSKKLRELVDNFSILADKKEGKAQAAMFTENAIVNSYVDNKLFSSTKGNIEIGNVFDAYLHTFEIVYHSNGQFVSIINKNKATGTLYCTVTLIGKEDNKKFKTTFLIQYNDEYIKENNEWLIDKRTSNFVWIEKKEI